MRACEPLPADRRTTVRVNRRTLGWDGNVAALLDAVEFPFFMILPHDDLPHPDDVRVLHTALTARPAHVAANADMFVFGQNVACKRLLLPERGTAERVLSLLSARCRGGSVARSDTARDPGFRRLPAT